MNERFDEALNGYTLTVSELKKIMKVSRKGAYDLVRSGEVESIRIGRTIRVLVAPLRRKIGIDRQKAAYSRRP